MFQMTSFECLSAEEVLAQRGLSDGGSAIKALSSAVLAAQAPYVPVDTGALLASGAVVANGNEISFSVPYARGQYYGGREHGVRGRLWFARMKGDCLQSLLLVAANACGGEAVL